MLHVFKLGQFSYNWHHFLNELVTLLLKCNLGLFLRSICRKIFLNPTTFDDVIMSHFYSQTLKKGVYMKAIFTDHGRTQSVPISLQKRDFMIAWEMHYFFQRNFHEPALAAGFEKMSDLLAHHYVLFPDFNILGDLWVVLYSNFMNSYFFILRIIFYNLSRVVLIRFVQGAP